MRHSNTRKYPITQMKKNNGETQPERIVDLSLSTAAGLLGMVFIEGALLGYMIRRWRR